MAVGSKINEKGFQTDEELRTILELRKSRVIVLGIGGAGNNTITRLKEIGIEGAKAIAVNTDAQDLLYSDADDKVLIGKGVTGGLGAGGDPKIGFEAARENKDDIDNVLRDNDMAFITCGLGGGTGTGASPVIAERSKQLGLLTIGVVTLPFSMEGKLRMENAKTGLNELMSAVDTLIVVPNDKLLEIVPDVSMMSAFKVADEILVNSVKGITELITKPGLVNLDLADLRAVMKDKGLALIGMGMSKTGSRVTEAAEKALSNPLLSLNIEGADGALINITGGSDITIREANQIVEVVSKKLSPNAKIIWGAQIDPGLKGSVRVLLIITGVKPKEEAVTEKLFERKKYLEKKFGIDFL